MLRSPLHHLISLHRFLLRCKTRHRSSHLLFRPISKTTSWSAGIISKISTTSSPIIPIKYTPTLGQQHEQANQLLRILQQHSTSTTRRLFPHRRTPRNGSVCIQRRTMVSSGSSSNGGSQITNVLNATHFFTPRPPILGVHGTPLLPPPPPASFRPYSTKSPWNLRQQQQYFITSSSTDNDMDADGDTNSNHFDISTRFHKVNHQYLLTNPTATSATSSSSAGGDDIDTTRGLGKEQQHTSYRPPNIRGMADLMDSNDNDGLLDSNPQNKNHTTNINVWQSGKSKVYHPGLVHRGQPPRRSSPSQQTHQQQKLQRSSGDTTVQKGVSISPVDVLRYDDLSLQATKKKLPSTARTSGSPSINNIHPRQQQWYLAIPMDFTSSPSHGSSITTSTSTSPLERLMFTENAVSILDPAWLTSFDTWEKRIREHLSKVMALIQLVGMEAQRYSTNAYTNVNEPTTTMDFKMMMKKSDSCTELHIFLPHELFAPLPTTHNKIQHWVDQLMKEPPNFEVKCLTSTAMTMDDTTTALDSTSADGRSDTITGSQMNDDDDLVMVSSRMTETDQEPANDSNQHDDSSWHIGPHYFQDIHAFLNHVDSMIESSPAFTSTGSHR